MSLSKLNVWICGSIIVFLLPGAPLAAKVPSVGIAEDSYLPDSVIVRFKSSASPAGVSTLGLKAADPTLAKSLKFAMSSTGNGTLPVALSRQTHLYKISDGSSVQDKIAELQALPDVALAEPNYKVQLFKAPSDTEYNDQWYLRKIAAPGAWDTVTGSKRVKVCVLDSGARADHPDLAANIIKGWNVLWDTPPDEFYNFNDTIGHGTHVAGLIGAVGNNARGISGVAWQVGLLICNFIDWSGGAISDALICIRLCRKEGALIYSNSWGGLDWFPQALLEEIQDLQKDNALWVIAAGNNSTNLDIYPKYPASFQVANQITVAATTDTDTMAGFSEYGQRSVQMAAPGQGIYSTLPDLKHNGGYGYLSGTSMATPLVSGAAALLQAMALNSRNAPLSPMKIKQILMETSDPMPWGSRVASGGRMNIARAVEAMRAELAGYVAPSPPPVANPSPVPFPQVPRAPASDSSPSSPPSQGSIPAGSVTPPECGTSPLRGQNATQSSQMGIYAAENAVNGDCRNSNVVMYPNACSATDPTMSNAWWTAALPQSAQVLAVSVTTRADCCWNAISGAIILVGSSPWISAASRSQFNECGRVPAEGIMRAQRLTVTCDSPVAGSFVAVFLPKTKTSLILCEVDVTLGGGAYGYASLANSSSWEPLQTLITTPSLPTTLAVQAISLPLNVSHTPIIPLPRKLQAKP